MVTVTFSPIGLPSGVTYLVSIGSVSRTAVTPEPLSFSIPAGNYTYSYSAIPCGYPNVVSKATINGNQTIPIQFTKSITSPCNCQKVPTSTSVLPTSTKENMQKYLNYGLAATFLGAAGIIGYKFFKLK